MKQFRKVLSLASLVLLASFPLTAQSQKSASAPSERAPRSASSKSSSDNRPDIATAVKAAAVKDCGCGSCAAKGCEPCRGKNCYYCAAKALVATDCGCKTCDAKGCSSCGPGCDVCKFHLAPVAQSKAHATAHKVTHE